MLFAVVLQVVRRGRADEVEQRLCLPELTALPAKAAFIVAVIQQAFQVLLCKIAQNKTFGGQKFHFNALLFIVAYFFGAKTPQPSISSAMMWERV